MQAGRLPRGAAGLLLAVALLVTAGCGTYVAPAPTVPTAGPDPVGAQRLLQQITGAIHAGRTVGTGLERAVTANAARLHVAGFTARYISEDTGIASGRWTADVEVTWRFAGFDARRIDQTVAMTFANVQGGVRLSSVGGQSHRTPLWLTGPLQVRRGDGTLVLVAGKAATADQYARMAARAVTAVRQVVAWPHPNLVLEVPASESAVESDLDASAGSYAGVAAVTTTVDGSSTPGTPVHVMVNPQAIGDLHDPGAQVVLSHEATHDATHVVPNSTLPKWLLEGFADYVALRDVRLPFSVTAKELRADVRRNGAPRQLPTDAAFNAQAEDFGEEYEQAWTACRTIAGIGGQDALVRVYDEVRDGAPLEASLEREIGMGVAGLTAQWRANLEAWSR